MRTIAAVSDVVEALRLISAALLLLTLVILGARVNNWWCSRWRCLLPAAGTGAIALFVELGTLDSLLHARPGGLATVFVLLAGMGLLMQACTVGLGRSHPAGRDHPAGGAYVAFDPQRGSPCGPDTPAC